MREAQTRMPDIIGPMRRHKPMSFDAFQERFLVREQFLKIEYDVCLGIAGRVNLEESCFGSH